MIFQDRHIVTETNGPRPAGPPDECFYCRQKIGSEHALDCVCRNRTVMVRVTIEYPVVVPESWTAADIEFHRNEGSWCSDNLINELDDLTEKSGICLCSKAEFKYLREETEEESKGLEPFA